MYVENFFNFTLKWKNLIWKLPVFCSKDWKNVITILFIIIKYYHKIFLNNVLCNCLIQIWVDFMLETLIHTDKILIIIKKL